MAKLCLPNITASNANLEAVIRNERRVLDQTKPYAEVHGLPGARYEQFGIKFRSDFIEILPEEISPYIEEIPELDDNSPHPIKAIFEQQTLPADMSSGETLETMSLKSIKLLVEGYGEKWPGDRKSAIAILKGKNNGLEA